MKEIPLTKGQVAIVDDEDFEFLSQWKWSYTQDGYAVRGECIAYLGRQNGHSWCKYKRILMHRVINKTPDGMETDHINRNKLDNRKENLRTATRSQNRRNHDAHRNNITGVCGVNWYGQLGKYCVRIVVNGKKVHLGYFTDIEDAIRVRREAEQKYFAA